MISLLEKAIQIAVTAHSGAKRRNGTPYVLHPLRMMTRVNTDDEQIVAVLHDVVEDTQWTLDDLKRQGFPDHILAALDCVTKREGESYEDFIERAASNPLARRVKIADLRDNMNLAELPEVTEKDTARMAKYATALHRLTNHAGVPSSLIESILPGNQLGWASAIGLFLIDFATLNYLLFCFLQSRLRPEELTSLKGRHFKDRMKRAIEVVAAENYTPEDRRTFDNFFNRLDFIREARNHIAHGHMLLHVADDCKSISFGVALPQDFEPGNTPRLTLAELQTYSRELLALIELFKPLAESPED